ncbi:conserved hypothetical protein [uncultured delta proteobacterium]|uniref:Polysaccharide biosynthesis enzyme WcbI domain-containing protein n=1 Tax=uncultured delta proteobacterium TaxID=34034 RepID=A0A212KES1_9DELT|nr:conserved hypothetical protein [uncultured delta proteobacterium]
MNVDAREDCLIHANCQAEPLARLLLASPEFAARWRIRIYTNYTREAIPAAALKNASLFLYQHLTPEWGELSSESLLARIGPQTRPVCIPTMFFLGYWPFWTKNSPMEFGDYFLDKLFEAGAGKPEMLRIYLRGDVTKMADLEDVVRKTLETEFAKEERCAVKTAGFVAENWKTTRMFQTVNHPDTPLLLHVAQGLLACLGLPPLPAAVCEAFTYDYEGFCLPIHPGVAAFHGLPFAGEETLYPVFGRGMTFSQYVSRYIDCRINHLEETFLGYLQMV